MMKKNVLILVILVFGALLQAQSFYKTSFTLQNGQDSIDGNLYGNGIVDLIGGDSVLWAATGYGLNKVVGNPAGSSWRWTNYRPKQYVGKGGVSAMNFMDDSTLWIATAFDTTVNGADLPAGGGLSYTRDGGQTWTHIPQPVDARDVSNYAPTTTVVQNLTYDIAFVDSAIWIASFGGGLRRSDDMGQSWKVVTTDSLFFSSAANLNHRAFSLLTVNDTLWVGTAQGISKSADNGLSWQRFRSKRGDAQTISGEFIVSLAYQPQRHAVWAATIEAEDTAQARGVCRSTDGGKTWQRLLIDRQIFAHNFAFDGDQIFIPSDKGLYYSSDNGASWQIITTLQDADSRNEIFQKEYYSAAVQNSPSGTRLWLGGSDGLATTFMHGNLSSEAQWRIFHSYVSVKARPKPAVYAYPSPFSPSRNLFIRFEYDPNKKLDEPIKIYDFAMDLVATIPIGAYKPKWDGKNTTGAVVASGVYFFRAKTGGQVTWGKIVVIN